LAYTDNYGNAINHPTFVHLAFIPALSPGFTEEMQIQEFVYDKLSTLYQLNKYHDVEVLVARQV
jgi:hypothetical protein